MSRQRLGGVNQKGVILATRRLDRVESLRVAATTHVEGSVGRYLSRRS